jgi:DNA-binding SARP family transcriptional activator
MPDTTEKRYFDLRKFATNLRQLTAKLPSESEKSALRREFQEVISFISQAQQALDALPSMEQTDTVRKAVNAFEELETKAKSSPLLAAALGIRPPRQARAKPTTSTHEESADAEALLRQLRSLPIDDMSKQLGDQELTSSKRLFAVASLLGIKPSRKQSRDALVQQIVTKISNFRGYEQLQGRTSP